MPLPNNPYSNKRDLVYVYMLELADRVRGGFTRLSRFNFKLLLMLQSTKQKSNIQKSAVQKQHHA